MVITHKKSTKLETAYYNIIWRLNNAGIKYETENHIIPQYNPDARDENGNPYPEPAPDSVGTGTAWIKIFHEDHKIVFVYFCCHLVECKTCTYDRFITVYNYTDDVKDTNLQGMLPALTLKYYADREENDKDRTIYFDEFSLNDLGYEYITVKKPVTNATETTCETCNGKGTVESETTVPSGNPYVKPVTIKINTTCPDCHGTGKTIEETDDNFTKVYTFNVYGFYAKKSVEEHDIIDNRINDGVREGLPDDDPSNLGEGGLVKYAKRLYTSENSYDPEDAPVAELSKITTYNTELYLNNGKLLNSVDEIYELIEKTNVDNKNLPEDEKVDLSKYLFAIPVFRVELTRDADNKPANDYQLIDFRFYQTNYVDQYGKLIPIVAFCAFDTRRNSRTPYFSDGYNVMGYSDRSSFPLYPEHVQYNPNKVKDMFPSYTNGDIYTQKGIKNFTKHCGEIETANGTVTSKQTVIIRPMISTFTDISQTDRVWNFICYKDKNLPIVPCDRDTLYISETTWPYKMDLYKDDHVKFNNILSQKTAAYVEPLDSKLLGPGEDPTLTDFVYPVDTFKGAAGFDSFEDLHVDPTNSRAPLRAIFFAPTSNNNTILCEKGLGTIYPDTISGIVLKNSTERICLGVKIHVEFHESFDDAAPKYLNTDERVMFLRLALQDYETNGNITLLGDPKYVYAKGPDIKAYVDPEDPTKMLYKWPMTFDEEFLTYIDDESFSYIQFPIKNKRLIVCFDYVDHEAVHSTDVSKNPYSYDDVVITVEVSLTTNTPKFAKRGYPYAGAESLALLPKIQYNYNNYPEGVFTYYQTNFGTYIENYIFHKYGEDHLMDVDLDTEGTDEQIKLIPDTIESQKEYHGFMNILYEKKLRSIYTKMDTHNDFIVCPACNGMDDIDCAFCGNKRKLSIFDCNIKSIESDDDMHKLLEDNSLKRYVCPSINDIDHEHRASCYGRCRCCAGTKSVIRYYYLKVFEFKNLTEYDGKLPKEVPDLSDIEALDIIGKVLESKVKEKGSSYEEAYLNYIVRKHYDVEEAPGEELDVAYSQLYNAAANNLVFYILNGNFIAYYFWNGYTHVKVDYGYNYIYSTKTYSKKEWEKIKDTEDGHKSTLLYRIISTEQEVDDMVGFYSINVPNVKIDYQDVSSIFEGATVQRIYFDKSWVYSNLLSDMTFKHFNMFTEKESLIVGNHQSTEDYAHIHDEEIEDGIVQSRCPTCNGTGEVDGAPCETCGGTGDYPDNVLKENLYYTRQLYCYTSLPYINTDNISFEVNDQQKPEFNGIEVNEINYEE